MNMFLHGVNDAHIEWGDTLANPLHLENDKLMKFNVIYDIQVPAQCPWFAEDIKEESIALYK
jgi:type I restriction enzyme M protein